MSVCSIRDESKPDLETAIPQALLVSNLGIITAEANNGADGAATYVSVVIGFKRENITSSELHQILEIIVDNSNLTPYSLRLIAVNETLPDEDWQLRPYINLAEPAQELGLKSSDDEDFKVQWAVVEEYLNNQ